MAAGAGSAVGARAQANKPATAAKASPAAPPAAKAAPTTTTTKTKTASAAKGAPAAATTTFTRAQIIEKRKQGRCWIVIHGNVYDVTEFLEEHPGGEELITDIPAADFDRQTTEFDDAAHSEEAMEQLLQFFKGKYIAEDSGASPVAEDEGEDEGVVGEPSESAPVSAATADAAADEEGAEEENAAEGEEPHGDPAFPFSGRTELTLPLIDKQALSHDVTVFRFGLAKPDHVFSLDIGKHILLSFEAADGSRVSRAYTPVSPNGDTGFVDFLVKLYPTGKMSQHLASLALGDAIKTKGPKGKLAYEGRGIFRIRRRGEDVSVRLSSVGMIAGGSGITPMFQIIQAVAADPEDDLQIYLLFANKTEADIILRHPLDHFVKSRPHQIHVRYVLDQPPPTGWTGGVGFVTADMIQAFLPPPAADNMVFLCGPPPMLKKACAPALKQLGYAPDAVFKF